MFEVFLHNKAVSGMKKAGKEDQKRIKEDLKKLEKDPYSGKKLSGCQFYKIRTGDYRSIYEINNMDKKVIVLFIGHRKNVYDNFSKFI